MLCLCVYPLCSDDLGREIDWSVDFTLPSISTILSGYNDPEDSISTCMRPPARPQHALQSTLVLIPSIPEPVPVPPACVPSKRTFAETDAAMEESSRAAARMSPTLRVVKSMARESVDTREQDRYEGSLKKHIESHLAPIQEETEESAPRPTFIPTDRFDGAMGWAYPPSSSIVREASSSSSFSTSHPPSSIPSIIPSIMADHPDAVDGETDDTSSLASSDDASVFDQYSDSSSYTASLLSDVQNYRYENGRRYHSYREGHYVLPNDEQEQDRQDLLHHVRNLVLNGQLFRAPLGDNIQRVLDVGTGTGIWAIDYADSFPSAEVIGTDLSPIQPSWVPPNLRFIVDDAESPWLYSRNRPFDFIHARDLGGAITDWPRLIRQSYEHLRPGGWLELQEFEVTLRADDDSMRLAPTLCDFIGRLHAASEAFCRPMNIAEGHRQRLVEAGFEDVRDDVYKVISSPWAEDPVQKEIGRYNQCSLLMAVESYSLALFTRVLGWSNEDTQVFLAGVRRDIKNPAVHSYCYMHVVYGRKPNY